MSLQALCGVLGLSTKPNDAIAVLSPVYGAFDTSASDAQRQIIAIPMKRSDDNRYTVDYEAFETAITKHDIKLFIHCNPTQPCRACMDRRMR